MNRNDTPKSAGESEARKPSIPRNLEVLIKKASVDPEFRRLLLDKRAESAREIDLDLSPAEATLLAGIPRDQLEKIIQNTKVPPEQRDVFSGSLGKIMLATVVATVAIGIFMPSLGHTLTPEQRERMLRREELLKSELEKAMDSNDVNEVELDSEKTEEEQK
jgi:hypothetical protein